MGNDKPKEFTPNNKVAQNPTNIILFWITNTSHHTGKVILIDWRFCVFGAMVVIMKVRVFSVFS